MARSSKNIKGGSTGVIDTSALLNKLVAIRQEAQETDAALNAIGNRKHAISDVAEYMQLANILKEVREQIAALNGADINTKEYRDLSNLLSSMGKSANDVIDVMRELAGFKIDNVVDENAAKTQLKDLAQRAQQAFKGTPLQFELDADIFDEKDIKVQFQRVISAVNPYLKQLSTMIADVGWDKLVSNTAMAKTKKQIKKGSEEIVAELNTDIKRLNGKKKNVDSILSSFGEIKPRKIAKGKEQSQLDELFSEFIGAKSNAPAVINMGKGGYNTIKAAANYLKLGRELKATYDAAMQNPESAEAEYFRANQQAYKEDIEKFEQWCEAKKKALVNVQNSMKLTSQQINKKIADAQAEKETHYENVPDVEKKVSAVDVAKNTIAASNQKLSVALSAIFNSIIPQIQSEGENVGDELRNAIGKIFDTLKQEGIDVSVQDPLKHQQLPEGATLDDTVANGYYNNNIDMLNNLASQLRSEYSQYTTLSAEEVASDFGQKVKERMLAIIQILQQNGFATGADNGYLEELQKQQKQIQEEYNKFHDIDRPFAEQIKSKQEIVSKLNNALTSKYNEDELSAANADLGFTLKRYAAYKKNPNQEKFQANNPVFGEHVEEQLILAIKQAYENAIARGASAASLSKFAKENGVDLGKLDLAGAEKIVTQERDAILEEIETIQANAENNKKLLDAKHQELLEINKRVNAARDEQNAAADLILNAQNADAEASDENKPTRKRGRPRKNPKPAAQSMAQEVSVADAAILREEGDKIVSAINQNTDKIISVLGGDNTLKNLEMTSAATNDFSTANADEAEAQLKQIYSELKAYRMSRSRGKFDPLYRESKTVAYQKAYAEAQRQGVSEDTLKAYKLNVTKKDYNQSLAALESSRDSSILQTLNTLGSSVKQLADSLKADGDKDNTKILEAINAITEQMRVCCDSMSAMQDIKPALEPISQISNTLGEILAKVSALGGGEGTSAVDAQKEALKQNLKEYFNRVSEHNNKTELSGDKTAQETGASIYKNGKVSYYLAESHAVPADLAIADFIRNLQDTPVVSLHSHPWAEDYGDLWANNTFSPEDINYSTVSRKLGIGLEGEISGNLLRILDISKLTVEEIGKITQAYQTQMAPLSKLYPDLFISSPSGAITERIDDTLDGHILANQLIDDVLRESIQSVNKNPDDIFRIFDITDDKSIDALANLILEVGESAQSAMSPIERLQHILDAFGKPALDSTQLARLADGSMQPMEVLYDRYDQVPGGNIIDTTNENQEINLLTSINATLSSIQQVLSTIQTVVARPQNITRQFFDDLNGDLDIFKYTKSNYDGQDHSNYKAARIHDEYENARHQRMEAYRYANDNRQLDKNGVIDRDTVHNVEAYIQAFQKYIGSIYDRIKFIQTGRNEISPSDESTVTSLTYNADNEITRFLSEPIIQDYLHYLNQNQPSADVQSSSRSYHDVLNSIVGKLESIIEVLHDNITLKDNSVNKDQIQPNDTSIDGYIDDWKRPYTTEDNSRKSMPTAARNNNDDNNHPHVTNDVYQLLSSNPYATEATLSKVLAKLESGIKTSGGKTKDNLSDVRDIFNKATRSEGRINKLISGNDDLKNTEEYAAYQKVLQEFRSKQGKYLSDTESPRAVASRLALSQKYLNTLDEQEKKLIAINKQQELQKKENNKDEYGIKAAYTSRFKANAKLEASLGSVPNIKGTQAYKDYVDAYNKMLEKKNDFFNYSSKTEAEKQELLNIALSAEEAAKNVDKLAKTQKEFEEIKARGTVMQGKAGLSGSDMADELQRLAGVSDAQKANFKVSKDNGKEIQTATYQVEDHTHKIHEMQLAYNRLTGEVAITETRVTQTSSRIGKSIDALKGKLKQVLTYIASYGSIYQVFNIIRQGITYVKDIDTALTDLKKVTSGTDQEYQQFLQHMSDTASIVGSTTQDLVTMSAEWARLGYSMERAGELAKTTAVLLNVSEFSSAEEASQALISTIQAYGYAAEDSMHVVDILNEVGKNIAHR